MPRPQTPGAAAHSQIGTLLADSPCIPTVGLGTFGFVGRSGQQIIECALDAGYRHIDTAAIYGNEVIVGRAIASAGVAREEVFLATKVWIDSYHRDDVARSVAASLRRLHVDYVDLLLLHWPHRSVPLEETIDALLEVHAARRCRHLGVSNFPVSLMDRARARCGRALVSIQVEYHVFLAQTELLAAVDRAGMVLVAHSPLAQGRAARHPVLRQIGDRHGKTAAQVALRWLIQQQRVAVIPNSTHPRHMRENLAINDFELSASEMGELHGLAAGRARFVDPKHLAPVWNE